MAGTTPAPGSATMAAAIAAADAGVLRTLRNGPLFTGRLAGQQLTIKRLRQRGLIIGHAWLQLTPAGHAALAALPGDF